MEIKKETNHKLSNNFSLKRQAYLTKKLSWSDVDTYFPNGLEMLFLLFYFILLPYIAGVITILLLFSNFDFSIAISIFYNHSFFLSWCVGYEVLTITFLIYFFKTIFSIKSA